MLCALALVCILLLSMQNGNKPDKNGMFKIDNMWFEVQSEFNENSAPRFAQKLKDIKANFLTPENKAYYAIIPDKTYFIKDSNYPVPAFDETILQIKNTITDIEYIDLFNALTLEDYYLTDGHWRQERLQSVVDALGAKMNFSVSLSDFEQIEFNEYIGSYGKYLPNNTKPESLFYLTNDATQNANCMIFGTKDFEPADVYNVAKLTDKIPYDVFLSGATPLVKIENENATTEKELIIFRDSYASSLAPLLISEYKHITLIDLRYVASPILKNYVEFTNQDVLFLYSTGIVANSALLR